MYQHIRDGLNSLRHVLRIFWVVKEAAGHVFLSLFLPSLETVERQDVMMWDAAYAILIEKWCFSVELRLI